jgi:hypothetical protein
MTASGEVPEIIAASPVVIAAFRSAAEAHQARVALERAGVEADVISRNPALERMCDDVFEDGFDVIVGRSDAPAAIAVVQGIWPDEAEASAPIEQCAECGSAEVTAIPRVRIFILAAIVLYAIGVAVGERDMFVLSAGIVGVLLFMAPNRRCRNCGERWTGERRVAPEDAIDVAPVEVPCPRCGSNETDVIPRRREKAMTMLVNIIVPPLLFVWPFLAKRRCASCGLEWR